MKSRWEDVQSKFDLIAAWCRDGLDEKQIYKNLGLGKSTWERYKVDHEDLRDLLKKSRETPIQQVENTLYMKATGQCWVEEITIENGIETKRVRKQQPPDMAAMAFYLKNKCRGVWRDKWDIAVENADDKPFNLSHISTEDLKELIKNED